MAYLNIINNRTISNGILFNPLKLNPVFWLKDLTTPVNGYWKDYSGKNKQIQAATTTVANDSLIMPANDTDIINALTSAGCYSVFYTNNSTPIKVLKSNILQIYGNQLFFNEWDKMNMCLFSTALTGNNLTKMTNFIHYVNWLFPTGVINFSQTIDFSKIFGKHQKI